MTIRWITPLLGTAPTLSVLQDVDIHIVDVRDLVDKPGNRPDVVKLKIIEGYKLLLEDKKTVVCCDYGVSRSNAVAVGILSMHESITFENAVRRVLNATGEKEIKVAPLQAVRRALSIDEKESHRAKPCVLVTGDTGFLGKAVCQNIGEGFKLVSSRRNELDLLQGTTELDLLVGEEGVDCIVHLANPRVYTSNVALGGTLTMLRNILDVCIERDIRLIYLSSFEVYSGYRSSFLIADESLPLLPKGPYGETKYLSEMMIEHSRRTQGLRCAILRSCSIYGPSNGRPKFIYNFIDKLKRSQPVVTHLYNNGLPSLDLLYIDDFVAVFLNMVKSNFSGNLNIGTGMTTSTQEIAEVLRNLVGGNSKIDEVLIDSDTAGIAMDARKAQQIFGWEPTINIEQGFRLVLENLKNE
jgi:nucleoside-diphosphate-sugar epimerase